jgi:cyclopropane fatty-acyl-phospholipid synthase-like methyltransferase
MTAPAVAKEDDQSGNGISSFFRRFFSRRIKKAPHKDEERLERIRARKQAIEDSSSSLPETNTSSTIENRVTVTEALWGKGFSSPCGIGLIEAMIHPINLEPGQEVLEIGCGIGGGATFLTEKRNVRVTALERTEEFIRHINNLTKSSPKNHPISFGPFDPSATEFRARAYDAILIKDTLFQIPDKEGFLKRVKQAAKSSGQLAICEFVLTEKGTESEKIQSWKAQEAIEPLPLSVGELLWNFRASGFQPMTQKDITSLYLESIQKALPRIKTVFAQIASSDPPDKKLAHALLDEATLWLSRAAALESGDLRVYYFHVVTKELSRKMT